MAALYVDSEHRKIDASKMDGYIPGYLKYNQLQHPAKHYGI